MIPEWQTDKIIGTLNFFNIHCKIVEGTLAVERDSICNAFPGSYENESYQKALNHINDSLEIPGQRAIWGSKNDDYLFVELVGGNHEYE